MGILSRLFGPGTTTDVLEFLEYQHDQMDDLIERLEKGEGNRVEVFTELGDLLAAHASVEEKVFYPAVMAKSTSDMLHEGVEEHLSLKRILADMITAQGDDETFKAKLSVLKEQLAHHNHHEEEKELFPEVKSQFDADERAALGNEVIVLFEALIQSHPLRDVPNETDAAAPLPQPRA